MNLAQLRELIRTEAPSALMLGTVEALDVRGSKFMSVRLSGGRVVTRCKNIDADLDLGDRVLVARVEGSDYLIVVGRIQTTHGGSDKQGGILAPPENFIARTSGGVAYAQWDNQPVLDLCWEVEYATQADYSDATSALVTMGSYYVEPEEPGSTAYFRGRAVRYLGVNNVAYSAWSAWQSVTVAYPPKDMAPATELTISSGAITPTQAYHSVDTEGDAPSDDLDTIGGSDGQVLVIKPASDSRTVTVKHNTGNIWLKSGEDIDLDDESDHIYLIYDGSMWSDIGAGGGASSHDAVTLASAEIQAILDLSTQALDLDTQAANHVMAGPSSGADAKPAFRALVADDMPAGVPLEDAVNTFSAAQTINASSVTALLVEDDGVNDDVLVVDTSAPEVEINGTLDVNGPVHLSSWGDDPFTPEDGLLLLGPHCPINEDSWTSLRGQEAEITGPDAPHLVGGPWAGTKALMVEEGTTNLCTNPSFETNANGWTNWNGSWTRTTDEARFGSYSYKCSGSPSRGEWMAFTLTAETTYTFSAWVKRIDGSPGIMLADYHTGPFVEWEDVVDVSSGTEWTRLQITFTVPTGEGGTYRLFLADKNTPGNAYYDGIQVEEGAQPTSYVDGSLPWGSWSGTAHASTSTRLATVVSLDTHAGLIDSNPQFSVVTNVRMPYDYNATWPAAYAVITEMRGSDASETITVGYDVSAQNIYLYVNGAQRATYSASFSAGDWLQIVSTFDYTNNEHNLYIDGVLQDTGTPVASANTKTTWRMGVSYSGGSDQAGLGFGQFAMLDSILTAEEVAALYQRGAPLVDTGAFDLPVTVTGDIYPADGSDITIHGDIGLNLDAPLGLMHGYKDFGGFLYWEGSVSGGGETTIIPDGSGDVEYGLSALYVATNRSGNTDRSLKLLETPSSGSNTSILYSGASDVYLTLYSTGKLTIDQTSGTETVYVNMLVIWQ